MASEYTLKRTVQFAETDLAGIMHFSNFFRLMEETEHAFIRSLGFSVHATTDHQTIGWPRAEASCRYLAPLRFEDEVEINLQVEEIGAKTVKYRFIFQKVTPEGPSRVAQGNVTTICVEMTDGEKRLRAIEIPATFRESIEPFSAPTTDGGSGGETGNRKNSRLPDRSDQP